MPAPKITTPNKVKARKGIDVDLLNDNEKVTFAEQNDLKSKFNIHADLLDGLQEAITTLQGGGTPSVPAQVGTVAPTAGDGQVTLAFAAVAGATSYTAKHRPAGSGAYATGATGSSSPLIITGLTNGVARDFTVTASNATGPGAASVPVTATPTAVAPTITALAFTAYNENGNTKTDDAGPDWSAFSTRRVAHNFPAGTVMRVRTVNDIVPITDGNPSPPGAGIYDGSTYLGLTPTPTTQGVNTHDFTLTNSGQTIKVVNSYQQRYDGAGPRVGLKVIGVDFLAVGTAAEQALANQSAVQALLGTSLLGGIFNTDPITQGPINQLRILRPTETIVSVAAGGLRWSTSFGTPTDMEAQAQVIAAVLGSALVPRLTVEGPVNDFYHTSVSSATQAANLGALVDRVRQLVPALQVLVVVLPRMGDETTARANNETPAQYRAGISTVENGRLTWLRLLDGLSAVSAVNLAADGIHLKPSGSAELAASINAAWNATSFTDAFDRADSLTVGNGWPSVGKIANNAYETLGGYPSAPLVRNTPTSSADVMIRAAITWQGVVEDGYGLMLRESGQMGVDGQGAAKYFHAGYLLFFVDHGDKFQFNLFRIVNDAPALVLPGTDQFYGTGTVAGGNPYLLEFKAVGNVISFRLLNQDGTIEIFARSYTDASPITAAGRAGISATKAGMRYDAATITSL